MFMDEDLGDKETRRHNLVAVASLSLMLTGMAAMVPLGRIKYR